MNYIKKHFKKPEAPKQDIIAVSVIFPVIVN